MAKLPAIIDGTRNVLTAFCQRNREKRWYVEASEYLKQRRRFIQSRFLDCIRYVDLHSNNNNAFSYELAGVLKDCGSCFGSVLDAMVRGSRFTHRPQPNIRDYRSFLLAQEPRIWLRSVHVRSRFPKGLILPLYSLKKGNASPAWWTAYNQVKHSEYREYRLGSLGNAATSLAALVILETVFGMANSDDIWTNVGYSYEEDSFDMKQMRRLFPNSE